MGKRELVAFLSLFSRCLLMVVWLFLAVPWVCLWFVIVVFPDHTHLVFFIYAKIYLHVNSHYLRSRSADFIQICMVVVTGHGKITVKFWRPLSNFQGHIRKKNPAKFRQNST